MWIGGSIVGCMALMWLLLIFPYYKYLPPEDIPFWAQPTENCYPETEIIYINQTQYEEIPIYVNQTEYHCYCNNICDEVENIWIKYLSNRTYVNSGDAKKLGIPKYNCVDFSNDMYGILGKLNFTAFIMMGKWNGGLHQWVDICLPFETTTGRFISPSEYASDYEFIKKVRGTW